MLWPFTPACFVYGTVFVPDQWSGTAPSHVNS